MIGSKMLRFSRLPGGSFIDREKTSRESWSVGKNCSSSKLPGSSRVRRLTSIRSVTREKKSRTARALSDSPTRSQLTPNCQLAKWRRLRAVRPLNVVYAPESGRPGFLSWRRYRSACQSRLRRLFRLSLPLTLHACRCLSSLHFAVPQRERSRSGERETGEQASCVQVQCAIWQLHCSCIYPTLEQMCKFQKALTPLISTAWID